MSKVDLVILGLLTEKSRHGYDILQQIENREMKKWVGISTPAIYKGLTRLESKRVLRARTESSASHPDRTVYEITADGREYFHRLMREALSEPKHIFLDMLTGIGFAHLEDKRTLIDALKERQEKLLPLRDFLDTHSVTNHCVEGTELHGEPITANAIIDFYRKLIALELDWLDGFIVQVRKIRNWPEGVFKK